MNYNDAAAIRRNRDRAGIIQSFRISAGALVGLFTVLHFFAR